MKPLTFRYSSHVTSIFLTPLSACRPTYFALERTLHFNKPLCCRSEIFSEVISYNWSVNNQFYLDRFMYYLKVRWAYVLRDFRALSFDPDTYVKRVHSCWRGHCKCSVSGNIDAIRSGHVNSSRVRALRTTRPPGIFIIFVQGRCV